MEDKTKSEQIILHCLLVNDYLNTIMKAIAADGQEVDGFVDYYSDMLKVAADKNWEIHRIAEEISRDDYFRKNMTLD